MHLQRSLISKLQAHLGLQRAWGILSRPSFSASPSLSLSSSIWGYAMHYAILHISRKVLSRFSSPSFSCILHRIPDASRVGMIAPVKRTARECMCVCVCVDVYFALAVLRDIFLAYSRCSTVRTTTGIADTLVQDVK